MSAEQTSDIADHTPVIVAAGQYVERIAGDAAPPIHGPMHMIARAAQNALREVDVDASHIDSIAIVRLFSDSAPAWRSPFGGSDNPPASVAARIGAAPAHHIYSHTGGTAPLQLLLEMMADIARGERDMVLLAGGEAIANQRHALRQGLEADWNESFDLPLDNRDFDKPFASRAEIHSGMLLPAHYYALIETRQAHLLGHSREQHRRYMACMMAPFSAVAADNPYAQQRTRYSVDELAASSRDNYPVSLPLTRRLVAQDAVNQGAALLLTSARRARELGIAPQRWVYVAAYAEGEDRVLSRREEPGRSAAMAAVFDAVLDGIEGTAADMDPLDLYSCFPCAVHAACEALELPTDGSRALTVTGGLPYFGGPGNNYSMHALAEMVWRLRGAGTRALVTANGGLLSKHAAAVLSTQASAAAALDWRHWQPPVVAPESIAQRPECEHPTAGRVISYTVIARRDKQDLGVVLCEDAGGARFLASSEQPGALATLDAETVIGREVAVSAGERGHRFAFADG